MTDEEIVGIFGMISELYEEHLKPFNVHPISLKNAQGKYTRDALVLIYLSRGYPNTQAVSKQEITEFVRKFYPDTNDMQQARHLAKQKGYNIASGTRGDLGHDLPAGFYKLINLTEPYPSFSPDRRAGMSASDFEELKKAYGYKCATCGSVEGEPHNFRKGEKTKLQAGHMNPNLPLERGNVIPQCQVCNRPDRNRWIYDKTGRAIGLADSEDGRRVVEKYLRKASAATKKYFLKFIKELLNIKNMF